MRTNDFGIIILMYVQLIHNNLTTSEDYSRLMSQVSKIGYIAVVMSPRAKVCSYVYV